MTVVRLMIITVVIVTLWFLGGFLGFSFARMTTSLLLTVVRVVFELNSTSRAFCAMINGFICLCSFACFDKLVESCRFGVQNNPKPILSCDFLELDLQRCQQARFCSASGLRWSWAASRCTGANILLGCNVIGLVHGVPYVPLLFREAFSGWKKGHYFAHGGD